MKTRDGFSRLYLFQTRRQGMAVALNIILAGVAFGQTTDWTGITSDDWFTGTNWDTGTVPTTGTVILDTDPLHPTRIAAESVATAGSL